MFYTHIHVDVSRNIMTSFKEQRTHFFIKKYTSHTLLSKGLRKGWCWLCVRGELETEQTATYWPQVPLTIAALLPHSAGLLNRGPEGPSPLSGADSHYGILSQTVTGTRIVTATRLNSACLELQLTQTVCGTWLYIVWRAPASCGRRICTEFNPSTGQGDIPIS